MQTIRVNPPTPYSAPRSVVRPIHVGMTTLLCLALLYVPHAVQANSAPVPNQATSENENSPSTPTNGLVQFERDIAPILKTRCLGCHQGEKARGGFDVSSKDAVMGYIEIGNASQSSLWTDYLIAPRADVKESSAMPPEGPLPTSDLALFKLWIDEGAKWPEGMSMGQAPENANLSLQMPQKILKAMGYFHPAVVHFPIALFCVGGFVAFLSFFLGQRCLSTGFHCLVLATVSSILSVILGWSYALIKGYTNSWSLPASNASEAQMTLFLHRWMGTGIAVLGIVGVILGLLARRNRSNSLHTYWRLITIFLALLVAWVGHQGGELVYGDLFQRAMEVFQTEV